MEMASILDKAGANLGAERVFAPPIERDGMVVILAAKVAGGGGGGQGPEGNPQTSGTGAGFGLGARPAGAFVIREGKVSWQAAVDVNRVVLGAQLVAASALLLARSWMRSRAIAKGVSRRPIRRKARRRMLRRLFA